MIMMIDEMITVKDYVKSLREDKENYFYTAEDYANELRNESLKSQTSAFITVQDYVNSLYNTELNETEEEIAARIEKSIKSAKSENEAQKLESLLA